MSGVRVGRRYTLVDAAYEVLKFADTPMHAADLADAALQNGLVQSATSASMNAAIWREIRDADHPRFRKTTYGYALNTLHGVVTHLTPTQPRDEEEVDLLGKIRDRLRSIRRFTQGIDKAVDAETICMWIDLCFVLELHGDVINLFNLLPADSTDPNLYARARKMVRVARMKEPSPGE
jgi:hypothetical protein